MCVFIPRSGSVQTGNNCTCNVCTCSDTEELISFWFVWEGKLLLTKVASWNYFSSFKKILRPNYKITELNDDFRMEAQQKLPHFCVYMHNLNHLFRICMFYCFCFYCLNDMKIAKNYSLTYSKKWIKKKWVEKKTGKIIEGHSASWILHEMYCVRYIRSTELEWSASGMEIGISEKSECFLSICGFSDGCVLFVVTHFDFPKMKRKKHTKFSFEFLTIRNQAESSDRLHDITDWNENPTTLASLVTKGSGYWNQPVSNFVLDF